MKWMNWVGKLSTVGWESFTDMKFLQLESYRKIIIATLRMCVCASHMASIRENLIRVFFFLIYCNGASANIFSQENFPSYSTSNINHFLLNPPPYPLSLLLFFFLPLLSPTSLRVCHYRSHFYNPNDTKCHKTPKETTAIPRWQPAHHWVWSFSIWHILPLLCTLPLVTPLHYRGWKQ